MRLPVQLGGKDMRQAGAARRAVARLSAGDAALHRAFLRSDDEGDDSVDNGPTGGLTWDGRVDRGRDQARIPLLSPFEMANASPAAICRRDCGGRATRTNSAGCSATAVFADPGKAFAGALEAFEVYEQSYLEFYPYSSKYDAYLAGKAELTRPERRGLAAVRGSRQRQLRPLPYQRAGAMTAPRRNSPITG